MSLRDDLSMCRDNWRDTSFWPWWWKNRVSSEAKAIVAIGFLAAVGLGGFVSAKSLNGAAASAGQDVFTVKRLVTVTTGPTTVTTAPESVIASPARRRVVTVGGPARTVTEREPGPTRTATVTNDRLVTDAHVVTVTNPVTVNQVVTETVEATVTATGPGTTGAGTVTTPPVTVTVTVPGG